MTTIEAVKLSDKVKTAFQVYKIGAICKHLGMHRNTLKKRLKDNSFSDSEIELLKRIGIE